MNYYEATIKFRTTSPLSTVELALVERMLGDTSAPISVEYLDIQDVTEAVVNGIKDWPEGF